MDVKALLKTASATIKELKLSSDETMEKVSELESSLKQFSKAKDIAFSLHKMGAYPAEDIEEQFNKFLEKPYEELETIEKAASLIKEAKNSDFFSIGKLSNNALSYESAEEKFLAQLLED